MMMMNTTTLRLVFALLLVSLGLSNAFVISPLPRGGVVATSRTITTCVALAAEGGPPQYDKTRGTLQRAEEVGEGSVMLHIKVDNDDNQENNSNKNKLDYKPGHVLALEIQDPNDCDGNDDNEMMNDEDTKNNGGWMRGPYTISRATDSTIDVLIRVVGKKSETFANAPTGGTTQVKFGGKFHVPILDGIDRDKVKKIVMISTGVGVGPCIGAIELALEQQQKIGAIELALEQQQKEFPPIQLLASFREESHVVYREHLNQLAKENPTKFQWTPIITSQTGRISASVENLKVVTDSIRGVSNCLDDVHYHLIGNGQMVQEWQAGLKEAGVDMDKRVTIESYFNHKSEPNADAIDNIAAAITAATTAAVQF